MVRCWLGGTLSHKKMSAFRTSKRLAPLQNTRTVRSSHPYRDDLGIWVAGEQCIWIGRKSPCNIAGHKPSCHWRFIHLIWIQGNGISRSNLLRISDFLDRYGNLILGLSGIYTLILRYYHGLSTNCFVCTRLALQYSLHCLLAD